MVRLIYIHAALIFTLSNSVNAQQKCIVCPPEIMSVCNGPSCAAVCVGGSCEGSKPETCKLRSEQGGASGQLQRISSEVVNGACLYRTPSSSNPISYRVE